jgi:signal transduction histidine kinase/CheY-like chemotaxis protein
MSPLSIRTQVALLALLPAVFVALVLAPYFTYSRLHDSEQVLADQGGAVVRQIAAAAEFPMVSGNLELLEKLLVASSKEAHVQFAQVRDLQGRLLASVGNVPAAPTIVDILGEEMVQGEDMLLFTQPIWLVPVEIDDLYLGSGAGAERRKLGWAVLGISKRALAEDRQQMLMGGLVMTLVMLLLTSVVAFLLGERIAFPLHELAGTVAELARGRLAARSKTDARGELRQLQEGVNEMAAALQSAQEGLQQRVSEATAELLAQKVAAEKANADKSRFLAATSHDLRQPMHALGLFAAALKEKITSQDQMDLLRKIEDSIMALEGMFNMLLDVSRLEAGILNAQQQTVLLQPLLARVAQEWGATADEKGLRFRVRTSRLAVHSDPILLSRIVNNLVKNAIRYTEHGGVLVGCRRRGKDVVLEVWDTGIGIAPQHQKRIFDEFYQVDNPERNRTRGLGLGLFIVQRLCRLLGHPIRLRSRPGRGSVFSLTLPGVEMDLEEFVPPGGVTQFNQEWVLLIEDDEQALAAMRILLEGWGLRVQAAPDLKGAVARLPDLAGPALILSDYRLGGGITGIAAVARLREFFGRPVPAALISGDTSQAGVADMEQSGLPVLRKPVRPAKLRALVNHLIAREGKFPPGA